MRVQRQRVPVLQWQWNSQISEHWALCYQQRLWEKEHLFCCIINTAKLHWKSVSIHQPFITGLITAAWLLTSRHRSGEDSSISFSSFLSTSSTPKYVSGSTATASSCSVWYWSSACPKKARSVTGIIWQPSVWERSAILQFVFLTGTWERRFHNHKHNNQSLMFTKNNPWKPK